MIFLGFLPSSGRVVYDSNSESEDSGAEDVSSTSRAVEPESDDDSDDDVARFFVDVDVRAVP